MNHTKHLKTLESLIDSDKELKDIPANSGIGSENMAQNYTIISKWVASEITTKHKLETFIFYYLHRLVLINLNVEQTNVPMIFEVINDRGVKLKPHEILKGKLLGLVDKIDLDILNLNEQWDQTVKDVNKWDEDEIDYFFWYFIRARYINTKSEYTKVSTSNYHRVIFLEDFNKKIKLKNNPSEVKRFIKQEFFYYTRLYLKLLSAYDSHTEEYSSIFYNRLNDQDTQFMLALSCCSLNDEQEDLKISTVTYEIDRFFSLLRLQKAYDSNRFNEMILEISIKIRDCEANKYRPVFDEHLLKELNYQNETTSIMHPFSYLYFRDLSGKDLPSRFLRYFYARIEDFLPKGTHLKMKHSFEDLVTKTSNVKGFHIEHILADNTENRLLFENKEELFYRERNRMGGLLLLKGRDNQSSNNESYKNKLKSYANTLYWNETLREDSYKSKLSLTDLIKNKNLNMRHLNEFGPKELEERQQLLSQIIEIIWN